VRYPWEGQSVASLVKRVAFLYLLMWYLKKNWRCSCHFVTFSTEKVYNWNPDVMWYSLNFLALNPSLQMNWNNSFLFHVGLRFESAISYPSIKIHYFCSSFRHFRRRIIGCWRSVIHNTDQTTLQSGFVFRGNSTWQSTVSNKILSTDVVLQKLVSARYCFKKIKIFQ